MPGADADGFVTLDVDISRPTTPAPPGGYPLLVVHARLLRGRQDDWRAPDFGTGEHWHYNNAWFASRGYVVVNYTSRGFRNQPATGGSTGETQLDSRLYEINDFQYLAGPARGRPVLRGEPAEGRADRRLLRRAASPGWR